MKNPIKKIFSSKEFNLDYSLTSTFEECLQESIDESELTKGIDIQSLVKTKDINNIKIIGKALAKFLERYR